MAINGSARKDANTAILLNYVLAELKNEGIETELIRLAGKKIHGYKISEKILYNRFNLTGRRVIINWKEDIFPPLEKTRWLPLLPLGLLFFWAQGNE